MKNFIFYLVIMCAFINGCAYVKVPESHEEFIQEHEIELEQLGFKREEVNKSKKLNLKNYERRDKKDNLLFKISKASVTLIETNNRYYQVINFSIAKTKYASKRKKRYGYIPEYSKINLRFKDENGVIIEEWKGIKFYHECGTDPSYVHFERRQVPNNDFFDLIKSARAEVFVYKGNCR
ncbi:MAG: hypothetical protein H6577_00550 [Lewinellaceae bacterium]|nr:hypothetical protein [Lewinellaceae bacterium]